MAFSGTFPVAIRNTAHRAQRPTHVNRFAIPKPAKPYEIPTATDEKSYGAAAILWYTVIWYRL